MKNLGIENKEKNKRAFAWGKPNLKKDESRLFKRDEPRPFKGKETYTRYDEQNPIELHNAIFDFMGTGKRGSIGPDEFYKRVANVFKNDRNAFLAISRDGFSWMHDILRLPFKLNHQGKVSEQEALAKCRFMFQVFSKLFLNLEVEDKGTSFGIAEQLLLLPNNFGSTPLLEIAFCGKFELLSDFLKSIKKVLDNIASEHLKDTLIETLFTACNDTTKKTPLHIVANTSKPKMLKECIDFIKVNHSNSQTIICELLNIQDSKFIKPFARKDRDYEKEINRYIHALKDKKTFAKADDWILPAIKEETNTKSTQSRMDENFSQNDKDLIEVTSSSLSEGSSLEESQAETLESENEATLSSQMNESLLFDNPREEWAFPEAKSYSSEEKLSVPSTLPMKEKPDTPTPLTLEKEWKVKPIISLEELGGSPPLTTRKNRAKKKRKNKNNTYQSKYSVPGDESPEAKSCCDCFKWFTFFRTEKAEHSNKNDRRQFPVKLKMK